MEASFETNRQGLFAYAAAQYQDTPEYLWRTAPGYAVLRRPDNRKWYALVMDLPRQKLGLPGGGTTDVLELKCDPILAGSLRGQPGILPAYHMNRDSWISVLLDGSVPASQLAFLLDISHSLTAPGGGRKKTAGPGLNRDWLIPANPAYYDIEQGLAHTDRLRWKQSSRVQVGDRVFIYVAAPVSAVLYQCTALRVNLPWEQEEGPVRIHRVMELQLVRRFSPDQLSREVLRSHGVTAVRGPRGLTNSLRHYIGTLPAPESYSSG